MQLSVPAYSALFLVMAAVIRKQTMGSSGREQEYHAAASPSGSLNAI